MLRNAIKYILLKKRSDNDSDAHLYQILSIKKIFIKFFFGNEKILKFTKIYIKFFL